MTFATMRDTLWMEENFSRNELIDVLKNPQNSGASWVMGRQVTGDKADGARLALDQSGKGAAV